MEANQNGCIGSSSNACGGNPWRRQILSLQPGHTATVLYPDTLKARFSSALAGLRVQSGMNYGYKPLGERKFEVRIKKANPTQSVTREDVMVLFELRSMLPPGRTLKDAVEFYLSCLKKLADQSGTDAADVSSGACSVRHP